MEEIPIKAHEYGGWGCGWHGDWYMQ